MELVDEYLNELYESLEFKRLLELKNLIDDKYKLEILNFKTAEDKYNEALKYPSYYPNIEELRNSFSKAKANLYSKDEVKEYLKLESFINKKLELDINNIKESISNKFILTKPFNLSCKR